MPGDLEFRGFELTGNPHGRPSEARRVEPGAVRIGVLADLRGRGEHDLGAGLPSLAARRPIRIDRDNLDAVLRALDVSLSLSLAGQAEPVVLPFRFLQDFHPDRILSRVEPFASLRSVRTRLQDPRTFEAAADDLNALLPSPGAGEPAVEAPTPPAVNPAALLDQILGQTASTPPPTPERHKPSPELGEFLRGITAGHVVRESPRQAGLVAEVDAALSRLLRDVLHDPRFQRLEALWRSLDFLTRRLEAGAELSIELIDASRGELEADLLSRQPLERTGLYRLIVEESVGTPGARPWSFLVADLTFGPEARDVALLWRLGQVARLAGSPLLAAASPRFVGCTSFAATPDPDDWVEPALDESWPDLRQSEEAPYLGLALPRFILRMPYGRRTEPIDALDFEEFDGVPDHEDYLWGNPAFALALMLGGAFDERGRFDDHRLVSGLDELPLPLEPDPDVEGGWRTMPCAEAPLGHRAAGRISAAGLMPLQSVRDRDAVHLASLHSIADPPALLALD